MLQTPYHPIKKQLLGLFILASISFGTLSFSYSLSSTCDNAIDLSLSLSSNEEVLRPGAKVTYSISIYNNGDNDATGIAVTSLIPSGLDHVTCTSLNADVKDNSIFWSDLEVPINGILTFTFSAFVQEHGDFVTIAEITGADQEDINSIPNNGADNDGDGIIGSYDQDNSQDFDDEDDGDDATIVISSSQVSSVDDNHTEEIRTQVTIAPNPSSDILNINITKKSNASIEMSMYSLMGELIKNPSKLPSNSETEHQETMDVSQLLPGKYILKVQIDDESYIKRVLIQE